MKYQLFIVFISILLLSVNNFIKPLKATKVIFFNPNKTEVDEASIFSVIRRCATVDHRGRCRN